MQRVTDLIDPNLLRLAPPRVVPTSAVLAVVGQRVSSLASRVLLDPLLIIGIGGIVILVQLGLALAVGLLAMALALRTWVRWRQTIRSFWEEIMLLRHGEVVRAYVLKAQTVRTLSGEIHGVILDCAIPLSPRRTHMGSVWLADGTAAMELARSGRMQVLALHQAPGIWRPLEGGPSEVRSGGGLTADQRDLMRDF